MKTISSRLRDGADLLDEINELCRINQIQAGVILSAVGGLTSSKIRVPVIDGKVKYISPTNLEITSLHGTVSQNGCHLHITVSDRSGTVLGGHLKQGCTIRNTCELVIGVLDSAVFTREPDPKTGYDELVVSQDY